MSIAQAWRVPGASGRASDAIALFCGGVSPVVRQATVEVTADARSHATDYSDPPGRTTFNPRPSSKGSKSPTTRVHYGTAAVRQSVLDGDSALVAQFDRCGDCGDVAVGPSSELAALDRYELRWLLRVYGGVR